MRRQLTREEIEDFIKVVEEHPEWEEHGIFIRDVRMERILFVDRYSYSYSKATGQMYWGSSNVALSNLSVPKTYIKRILEEVGLPTS